MKEKIKILIVLIFLFSNFQDCFVYSKNVKTNGLTKSGKKAKLKSNGASEGQIVMAVIPAGESDIKVQWVDSSEISLSDGSVSSNHIAIDAINSNKILNGSIANEDLANDSIQSSNIVDGSISNSDIADNAVTSDIIMSGAVLESDLADNVITSSKIVDGSIESSDLSAGAKWVNVVVSSDGTGDTTSIDTALTQVSSGGTVYILSGTYSVDTTLLANNIKIMGIGNVTISAISSSNDIFTGSSLSGIHIENINFTTGSYNVSAIDLTSCSNVVIRNCSFSGNTTAHLVTFTTVTNFLVEGCKFDNSDNSTGNDFFLQTDCRIGKILNNNFENANYGIRGSSGDTILMGNFISSNKTGLRIEGSDTSDNCVIVSNNLISSNTNTGIYTDGQEIIISNNILEGNGSTGSLHGMIVAGSAENQLYNSNLFFNNANQAINQTANNPQILYDGNFESGTGGFNINSSNATVGDSKSI